MTPFETRMACLKLAIGESTPLTLDVALEVVAVAKAYADFVLQEPGDPSAAPMVAEGGRVGNDPSAEGLR